jgi:hypothetical protein
MQGLSYDMKCDVFSFAIIMWEILSEELPFEGNEQSNLVTSKVINLRESPIFI